MEADLRYPIGKAELTDTLAPDARVAHIRAIEEAPARLRAAVRGLSDQQLDTPYRPGGWTVRQVAHHVPDSHMNAYIRFKLALTEDQPTIKPYEEARWAELADSRSPIEPSLVLLENLHRRWVLLLSSLSPADWGKKSTIQQWEFFRSIARLGFMPGMAAITSLT